MSTSAQPTTIMGIDPGYDRVGWAVIQAYSGQTVCKAAGLLQTNARDTTLDRYRHIITALQELVMTYTPDIIAVEELFFSTNRKTALRVAEARGIILASILTADRSHPQPQIVEVHPQTVKLTITGNGKADKLAVAKQLHRELLVPATLNDDALDAIAIAITGMHTYKQWYIQH